MKRMLQLAALAISLTFAGQALTAQTYPPNYCGDPCFVEGERAGCRCQDGSGYYRRNICTCINGHWSTLP